MLGYWCVYCLVKRTIRLTGRVTATYLSRDMAQRLRIDAVHIHTSTANHIEHHKSPKIHTCLCYFIEEEKKKKTHKKTSFKYIDQIQSIGTKCINEMTGVNLF